MARARRDRRLGGRGARRVAPTYLTFFSTAGRHFPGLPEREAVLHLTREMPDLLRAIALGAVFLGANTARAGSGINPKPLELQIPVAMLSSRFALAVHVLAVLAQTPGEPWTSDFLAGSIDTNPVVVRRLIGKLRQAGLVEVAPGPKGGTRLVRPAAEIDLATVYRAVEAGELLALHHHPPNPACPVGRSIGEVLGAIFGEAERALEGVLAGKTLADVSAAIASCKP